MTLPISEEPLAGTEVLLERYPDGQLCVTFNTPDEEAYNAAVDLLAPLRESLELLENNPRINIA